jgi:hypothetical protein
MKCRFGNSVVSVNSDPVAMEEEACLSQPLIIRQTLHSPRSSDLYPPRFGHSWSYIHDSKK